MLFNPTEQHLLLYSRLRGSNAPVLRRYYYKYLDSLIAVASSNAPGDKCHASLIGYRVHATWFQSITLLIIIRPSVAWYHIILALLLPLISWHLTTRVCDSSWYVCQQISWQRLSQLMPHPYQGYSACVIDLIGDQPILCQRRTWRVSSYRIRVLRCNAY